MVFRKNGSHRCCSWYRLVKWVILNIKMLIQTPNWHGRNIWIILLANYPWLQKHTKCWFRGRLSQNTLYLGFCPCYDYREAFDSIDLLRFFMLLMFCMPKRCDVVMFYDWMCIWFVIAQYQIVTSWQSSCFCYVEGVIWLCYPMWRFW